MTITPEQLTVQLAPKVRAASERARPDFLASLGPVERFAVNRSWDHLMDKVVPFETRAAIEFLIDMYRRDVEPHYGRLLGVLDETLGQSTDDLKRLHDLFGMVKTPSGLFLPQVAACLGPR